MKTASSKSQFARQLAYYTAATGAAIATSAVAEPTPSPSAPTSVTATDGNFEEIALDIDGNGVNDFRLFAAGNDDCVNLATNPGSSGFTELVTGNQISASPLRSDYAGLVTGTFPGDSPTLSYGGALLACQEFGDPAAAPFEVGPEGSSERGFVGVQFLRDGALHNGYVELQIESGSITTNVLSACYESNPREPITIGQCFVPTIPVNNWMLPMSLAMLVMGGLALRRRKQARAA